MYPDIDTGGQPVTTPPLFAVVKMWDSYVAGGCPNIENNLKDKNVDLAGKYTTLCELYFNNSEVFVSIIYRVHSSLRALEQKLNAAE